jgi:hypothetical protein
VKTLIPDAAVPSDVLLVLAEKKFRKVCSVLEKVYRGGPEIVGFGKRCNRRLIVVGKEECGEKIVGT